MAGNQNSGRTPLPSADARDKQIRDRMPDFPIPECPDYLNAVGREEWQRAVDQLTSIGFITHIDSMALAVYCQTFSEWRELIYRYQGNMIYETANGTIKIHPGVTHAEKLQRNLLRFAQVFGFTPNAALLRSSGGTLRDPVADEFDEFADRKVKGSHINGDD